MEFIAWSLHKYVMHGFLWEVHRDHHEPHSKRMERNDAFALVFAIPSFLMILFGGLIDKPLLAATGYGVMAYGFTYFLVHEVIIHRRFKFFRGRGRYLRGLIIAHRHHHVVRTKEGSKNFGMLIVHPRYFSTNVQRAPGANR
jgi:beta-carotene 3-hydroxylase